MVLLCMAIEPIKPSEVSDAKNQTIPDEIIQIFNDLIVEKWDGKAACIKQPEIVASIEEKTTFSWNEIFDRHFLDVEDLFRKAGWLVEYHKPAFNEAYHAFFVFSK
jgi:hypothetical protein